MQRSLQRLIPDWKNNQLAGRMHTFVRSDQLYHMSKYLLLQSHINTSASSLPVCPFEAENWDLLRQIISKGQEM